MPAPRTTELHWCERLDELLGASGWRRCSGLDRAGRPGLVTVADACEPCRDAKRARERERYAIGGYGRRRQRRYRDRGRRR